MGLFIVTTISLVAVKTDILLPMIVVDDKYDCYIKEYDLNVFGQILYFVIKMIVAYSSYVSPR